MFGGILNGLGLSLILNNNASSGGTDFIAMSLSNKYKVSTFNYMLLFSAVIILISGRLLDVYKRQHLVTVHILLKEGKRQQAAAYLEGIAKPRTFREDDERENGMECFCEEDKKP